MNFELRVMSCELCVNSECGLGLVGLDGLGGLGD